MREILLSVAVALTAYLLGCIPTGLLIANKAGVNIRDLGSKNTGASNVLRVMGLKSGLITFVGDFLKATLACWIGNLLLPSSLFGIAGYGRMLAGIFVIVGHNWPVFSGFQGGKGVSSSVAVILFADPLWGGVSILACLMIIALTRYISLGSLTMLLCYAVLMCVSHWGLWAHCVFAIMLFLMSVYRHQGNIQRLVHGTENKIGRRVKPMGSDDGA
ncbi:MAG: glycerol-3-phosphate 1-O-acyltransferase PlsY [Clostridia bacterium]|nr:glycerol-3-phosphate 1-O-acyltransferase PlsY [Clostridia bacterium]